MSAVWLGALLSRTADRRADAMEGVAELAPVLGARLGRKPIWLGSLEPTWDGRWDEDLQDAEEALGRGAAFVAQALDEKQRPLLLAGDCAIALSTLAAVARADPDTLVVWIDAHGDANTPATTPSGYLGGMALGAAFGLWDAVGFPAQLTPADVVLAGVRDLDAEERIVLDHAGVRQVALAALPDAVRGRRVFVHLDLDVCDPDEVPAAWPAPGGVSVEELTDTLDALAAAAEIVGAEVTSIPGVHAIDELADAVAALMD